MARPLEKNSKGKRLIRPSKIEAAIDVALGQDLETLKRRAAIRDKASPDYLPSECLVHLIRNSVRQSNSRDPANTVANTLLRFLIKRCEMNLRSRVSSTIATAEDLRQEILGGLAELFAEDFAQEANRRLDYFEVKFNHAFALFRIDGVRPELKRLNRRDNSARPKEGEEGDFSEGNIEKEIPDTNYDLSVLDGKIDDDRRRAWLHGALDKLPELERKALLLHFSGYKIESNDPKERTVATLCNVSGRTIRTWLKRALAELIRLREAA